MILKLYFDLKQIKMFLIALIVLNAAIGLYCFEWAWK